MFIRAKKFLSELISENLNLQCNKEVIVHTECQVQFNSEDIVKDHSIVNDVSSHSFDFECAENNKHSNDRIKENDDANFIAKQIFSPKSNKNIIIDMVESDKRKVQSEKNLMTDEGFEDIRIFLENKNHNMDDLKFYDKEQIMTYLNKINPFNEKDFFSINKRDDEIDHFKKILIVSHSGFISEMINFINMEKNIKPHVKHQTNNTGLYVIRIYCKNCGINSDCKLNAQCGVTNIKLECDFIITNDVSHLDVLKEQNK